MAPADADFATLGLLPALVRAAAAIGWATPTAIQCAALPAVLQGRDVQGQAPTGSGKTGAFLLPLLQRLLEGVAPRTTGPYGSASLANPGRPVRALVLAPTRELAVQIRQVAGALAPQLKTVVAVGGLSINPQMMALCGGADLVVATPGRLLDLVAQNALQLRAVELLVLDEADRLLDLGFADEIGRVLALLPTRRQTLLFSATLPEAVATLAQGVLRGDAVHLVAAAADVDGAGAGQPPNITQRAIVVDTARRTALLRHLITTEGWDRVLVFVATQYATEHVADKLRRAGLPAAALHGQLSQGRRSQVLADFKAQALQVLVATDLAARGIDVVQLAAVVNHDLPRSAVDHTHRIGRTGRAGAAGVALSFICADAPGSEAHFRVIEKRQLQRVARERVVGFEPSAAVAVGVAGSADAAAENGAPAGPQSDPNGGVKGRRKSKKDKLREAQAAAAAVAAATAARRR